ncbi:FtsX-like permease family protein [Flavobacteriaceae bacterium R38]|nr:FtsX-like permease family protein [Flavobacteriaceae bacterium R38]
MFDIERWQEIFDTIRKNKLRTFLTGLSVASGIFILVILLGFGQGMQNGVAKEFEQDATNRIWVSSRRTTKEYKGLNPGRIIRMNDNNFDYATSELGKDKLEYKSGVYRVNGGLINYKNESGNYGVQGVGPDYQFIENAQMLSGRFLNYDDLEGVNKVVVISERVQRELFKTVDPIDKSLQISGLNFQVIGVYSDAGGEREENRIYVPITTAKRVFNGGDRVNNLSFTFKPQENFEETLKESNNFTAELEEYLKQSHTVAPDDENAVRVFNVLNEAKRYFGLLDNINLFFWFVGICTIVAGVVGVSNIMLIIVKDRTREIGIRKALGAKPWSIIGMILHEAVFVTAVSGFAGFIVSMGLLELLGPNIEVDYILNPSVDFNIAITTVFILIFVGAVAGFIPAWRAASIKPIVALRDE